MSGLDVSLCGTAASGTTLADSTPIAPVTEGTGTFAIAVPWTDSGQARLVTLALREGITGRTTDKAFTKDGREYARGTVLFAAGDNSPAQMQRLRALAAEIGAHTIALESSWVEDGPNLGSESFVRLDVPKVAIAWDEGVSQLSAGSLR